MKKCPYCAEEIQEEAKFCRWCRKKVAIFKFAMEDVFGKISFLLLAVALAAFFIPFVRVQFPMVGAQSFSGYEVMVQSGQPEQTIERKRADGRFSIQISSLRKMINGKEGREVFKSKPVYALIPVGFASGALAYFLMIVLAVFLAFNKPYAASVVAGCSFALTWPFLMSLFLLDDLLQATIQSSLGQMQENPFLNLAGLFIQGLKIYPAEAVYFFGTATLLMALLNWFMGRRAISLSKKVSLVHVSSVSDQRLPYNDCNNVNAEVDQTAEMDMEKDIVFSDFKIKGHTFKNRLGVAPMTRMSSGPDGIPRKDVLDFLVTRAKNGAAVVYTEAIVTDHESAQGYPRQSRLTTQRQIDAWRLVVKAIQKEGALAIMQMFHCGRIASLDVNPAKRSLAPSSLIPKQANPLTSSPYPMPDEMSLFDMRHVLLGFVETARGAIEAGFDGVELHCAHGYLLSQFLSDYSNKRKDAYGGSVENRFRFIHEILHALREVVPPERLLLVRISDWGVVDMDVSLFGSKTEYQRVVKLLSQERIDALSVSTYDFKQKAFGTEQNMAQITREVTALPIFICGKIYDRASAEQALEHADMVLSAKSMLLNSVWVADVKRGADLVAYKSDDANVAYSETPLL